MDRLSATDVAAASDAHFVARIAAVGVACIAAFGLAGVMAPAASATVVCPTAPPTWLGPTSNQDWSGCDLTGFDMRLWSIHDTTFTGANLTGANLSGLNLTRSKFINANLTGANLSSSGSNQTDFTGANLSGANFINAYLDYGADLTGAFVTCGRGGNLGTGITVGSYAVTLPAGWTLTGGVLTAPNVQCSVTDASSADASTSVIELEPSSGSCSATPDIRATQGSWMRLPTAEECTSSGRNLLGWSTSNNFPIDVAREQVTKGWGAIDQVFGGVRMTFVPAGGYTCVTGDNTLHAVWG